MYAESLKANGALPGFAPDEPGEIILDDAVAVFMHTGVEYPLELILRSRKRNDPEKAEYVYRLMKDAPDVEWKLIGTCKRVGGKNIWYMDMQEENPQPSTEGDGLKPAP
ncbi:MAG: hypothetical protein L6437_00065 [Kiritimatiellae bacterium]|nr:hypothetical protein [Kiritimatiellia bacterium]